MTGKRHKHSDKQSDYWLHITNKCNWNCTYCIADTHNGDDVEFEKVLSLIDNNIKDNTFVSLTGGEVGLLDKSKLDQIFNKLDNKNCTYCIDTNGLFLRNHKKYYSKIVDYFYHCSENLLLTDNILDGFKDPDNKVTYMIVVDDHNFKNVATFLNKWDNVLFHVHSAMSNGNKGTTLSKKNALKLFKICSKKENVNQEHLKYILNYYSKENVNTYLDSREII